MSEKRPIVGLTPLYDEERDSYWMLPGYMQMLEEQGALPLMLPLTDDAAELDAFLELCDGFLFTGGHDVSPEYYHEEQKPYCGATCPLRDRMEDYLLKKCAELDKTVLGICRGIQFMNVCFGGTLYQDLPEEFESRTEHHMAPPYNRPVHSIDIKKDSLLYDIFGEERVDVNSYHHQAIRELAPALEETARSEDGLIEAVSMPGKAFFVVVLGHRELAFQDDLYCRKLAAAFVEAMRRRQNPGRPEGLSGKLMLNRMNSGNHARLSDWGLSHLLIGPKSAMLEIGCGGGANVARLLARCPDGQVVGVDYSEVSVEKSRDFNAEAVKAGRCRIECANVQELPFGNCSFDLATAFETVYFWPDPEEAFAQVFRVLKEGGRFFICNEVDGEDRADYEMEKRVSGLRIYREQELRELLERAGFSEVTTYRDGEKRWICFIAVK